MPYFKGEAKQGPRDAIYYFDQGGNLNAIRWNDWKVSFAIASKGNIATGTREVTAWALITNLRMDPYERGLEEGGGAMEFLGQQHVAARADPGEDQGVLRRLRPVPLPGGQLAQCGRHQLRPAAAAGRDEAAQGNGAPEATIVRTSRITGADKEHCHDGRLGILLPGWFAAISVAATQPADPLVSWNDGAISNYISPF